MAVTTSLVQQGQNIFVTDVTWGADGDTTVDVNHGLGAAPVVVIYTCLATAAVAAVAAVGATVVDATKVTLTKTNISAGSGAAAKGRLICMRAHSAVG